MRSKIERDRIASIDIGSNTALLSIIEPLDPGFKIVSDIYETPGILKETSKNGRIPKKAQDKLIRCLKRFTRECKRHGTTRILTAATEALRKAKNTSSLIDRINKEAGLKVKVISARHEAYLSYISATAELRGQKQPLVIDIGGGSSEFGFIKNQEFSYKSLKIGASFLTKRFDISYPLCEGKRENIVSFIRKKLTALPKFEFSRLLGVGGTIISIPAIILGKDFDIQRTDFFVLKHRQVAKLLDEISRLKIGAIKRIPGMPKDRAHILVPGLLILKETLSLLGKPLTVRNRGLRFGMIFSYLEMLNDRS